MMLALHTVHTTIVFGAFLGTPAHRFAVPSQLAVTQRSAWPTWAPHLLLLSPPSCRSSLWTRSRAVSPRAQEPRQRSRWPLARSLLVAVALVLLRESHFEVGAKERTSGEVRSWFKLVRVWRSLAGWVSRQAGGGGIFERRSRQGALLSFSSQPRSHCTSASDNPR